MVLIEPSELTKGSNGHIRVYVVSSIRNYILYHEIHFGPLLFDTLALQKKIKYIKPRLFTI